MSAPMEGHASPPICRGKHTSCHLGPIAICVNFGKEAWEP